MPQVICDSCQTPFDVKSIEETPRNTAGEPICEDCGEIECRECGDSLEITDLTGRHEHENGGWVCDSCPRVELPTTISYEVHHEPVGHTPSHVRKIFPDIEVGRNANMVSRELWNLAHFTSIEFRVNEDLSTEAVAVNGKEVDE